MTDFEDVSGVTTTWDSMDDIVIQNPGFEEIGAESWWPANWVLTLGSSAQAGVKIGDPSDAN